jgi:hypothetical protein
VNDFGGVKAVQVNRNILRSDRLLLITYAIKEAIKFLFMQFPQAAVVLM